ncbi:MAG: aldo/keto reductase [Flavipsychrobacter sp.]|nr:aldo/keto reductase [Flavipsychrobacter sp.]
MELRKIGSSDIQVAPWAFGGNVFGWTVDEQMSFRLLDAFVDAGLNLVDTADTYSRWKPGNKGGESETIIGKWMKQGGKRDKVIISTKVGSDMGDGKKGVSKKYILQAAEDSLKRLQTDHIDLYWTHFDDVATPVEETLEAYAQLVKEGKVRVIGTSNMSPERIQESLNVSKEKGYPAYQALQPLYNLYDREGYETKYEQIALDNNLGVFPYYALASGFLTGKYRSEADFAKSPRGQGASKYLNARGYNILKELDDVAAKHSTTPAAIAIAWLVAQPGITAPIASATKPAQMEDLAKGAQLKLQEEDVKKLDEASKY